VGAAAGRRGGGLTKKTGKARGPESGPLQTDPTLADKVDADTRTTRLVWEALYGHSLSDDDLAEIEGNLFRFIDLLASINGSILGSPELSTFDEAA